MTPRPMEFLKFAKLLIVQRPKGYIPWFFRCAPCGKEPALQFGSWKHPKNRIKIHEALTWMKHGGNIGIAGTDHDLLVNLDADGGIIQHEELKPTLTTRSRSRIGLHKFYFSHEKNKIGNIPTDDAGEVRSSWQYVLAAGSYVTTDPNTVPQKQRNDAGYYTVEDPQPPTWITYNELPEIFKNAHKKTIHVKAKTPRPFTPTMAKGKHSALFDLTAQDIVYREGGHIQPSKRWGSLFHGSTTDANMSLSTEGLLHCWRHGVSHNALQALTVLSGYMTCAEAGTPHRKSGAPSSMVTGNNGAIFNAWIYAKNHGYILDTDPIPVRAMWYIAKKHLNYTAKTNKKLPTLIYNRVLRIVREVY